VFGEPNTLQTAEFIDKMSLEGSSYLSTHYLRSIVLDKTTEDE
jgi:hypothetical protein